MTVAELIEQLQDMNPEAEARIASQPSWPFENNIDSVEAVNEIVYIGVGEQLGYLPGHVSEALGWK